MFEHFNNAEETFSYKLGIELTTEDDALERLEDMEKTAAFREPKSTADETNESVVEVIVCAGALTQENAASKNF
ncbi:hypothetical protein [Arthrobacter cryoconiti]|uniref:Uncharacterized protein n=1 Tax=Arthrobacter cryoconiti TaxID=748907 RepID=A0ABV8QZL1_9MICC|nr:hypothetical protein [Arthrobacter cryoconiti]MCC9068382.1 hypothetical protein [Arthrobacter cryoconiti]